MRLSKFLYAIMLTNLCLLSFFSLIKAIFPRVSTKPVPNDDSCPLPVRVGEHISLGICFPSRGTYITRDMCFPGRGTHITRDMCLPGRGTQITRDMCFPGRGTHITRDMCFPGREHISLG